MKVQPILTFSRTEERLFLLDRETGEVYFSYPAHNRAENINGNPLQTGSQAPAPCGFLTVSLPDFISGQFRREFYQQYFPGGGTLPGESLVCEWGEFEAHEMGRVRFALGFPTAPEGFADRSAWDRELLIHAGRPFDTPTKGCIRMDSNNIERFAAEWIRCHRAGIHLNTVHILPV